MLSQIELNQAIHGGSGIKPPHSTLGRSIDVRRSSPKERALEVESN
jgi:hypothetical protein